MPKQNSQQKQIKNMIHDNELLFTSLQSFLAKKTKAIVSKWTAATLWGFSPTTDNKLYIDVPRGYNPKLPDTVVKKQRTDIGNDIVSVEFEGDTYKVSSLEKTFIDLIKSFKGEYNDKRYQMVREFKKTDYILKRTLALAKEAGVYGEVNFMLGDNHEIK